ncbi:MAG: hypothetical protein II998_02490 [Clostridia bacterium]|nr:hypothetical protein [Clostridia bacterium]
MKVIKVFSISLLSLFCALLIFVGVLGYWHAGNIKAIVYTMLYSSDELGNMLDETYKEVDEFLANNPQYNVRPAGELEDKLHRENIISDDEYVELITGKNNIDEMFGTDLTLDEKENITVTETGEIITSQQAIDMKDSATSSVTESNSGGITTDQPGQTTPAQNNDDKISACVAQMYVLKSTFTSSLDSLYSEAIAKYKALPPAERESGKEFIMNELYPRAVELEKQCDMKVKAVLTELTALLKEDGQSLELVDKIRTAYYQEKSVRKAVYMEKL